MRLGDSAPADDCHAATRCKFSVCIAAYNEAARIGRLLDQLIVADADELDEILVCANGCEDGTEAVVASYRNRDSRVVLVTSEKGKPAAWNTLMHAARNDLRMFLDADVELAEGFLRAMRTAVQSHPSAAIIAARDLPRMRDPGVRARLAVLASRPFGFDYLCGRAYVLRQSAMVGAVQPKEGPKDQMPREMPLHVLGEDLWLEVYVGRKSIAFARDAHVYYEPGDLGDALRARARMQVARRQVCAMQPEAFARWRTEFKESSALYTRVRHRLLTTDDINDALKCTFGAAVRSVLLVLNRANVRQMEAEMLRQMSREGGQAVLSGSGRLKKKAS